MDYKLTDFYERYKKSRNVERLAFGTLYKMYGGKKNVDSYSIEMVWYLSSLVYMDAADKLFREKTLKFEKRYNMLSIEKERIALDKEFEKDSYDFYSRCFVTCLFNLKHYYDVEYKTDKKNISYIYNLFATDGGLMVDSSFSLIRSCVQGEIQRELRKVFIELYGLRNGVWIDAYKLTNVSSNLWHYIYNTQMQIKDRGYPEVKIPIEIKIVH